MNGVLIYISVPMVSPMLEQKRTDLVEQLDRLVIALSVYSYFCDPSFFVLLVRVVVQIQLTNPVLTTPTRSLPNLTNYLILLNIGIYLRHFLYGPSATFGSRPRGLFLNFIGQTTPTTLTQVLLQSTFIFVLQLVCLLVAYETGHNPPPTMATPPSTPPPLPASTLASITTRSIDSPSSNTSTLLDDLEAGGSFESTSDALSSLEYIDFLSPSSPSSSYEHHRSPISSSSHSKAHAPVFTTGAASSFSFASSSAVPSVYLTPEPPEEDIDQPILELELFSLTSRLTGFGPYARKGNPASQNERDQRMIRRRREKESERVGRKRRWRWRWTHARDRGG
ncbi:Domain of unknown function DUF1746, fungi [Phaffia rhodozyma]|uniref:DUF1746 domain-containing protein n=1 Tax=Phaffia rhodozyma TaxID=264483 RepID=A0A0F7SSM9_PHARH|nr:Domain of unknown function DUF1746, fungi [Phaffia rhodozyma]